MAYTEEQKEEIFEHIFKEVAGKRSLRSVLKDKGMPSADSFFKWIDEDPSKAEQYARATELRADAIFEEILTISDDQEDDVIEDDDGNPITNHNATRS